MAQIISASIDLNKIDKSKIQTKDKNGNPFKNGGKFLNIQIYVSNTKDTYGNDAAICISQSKEERESGTPKIYLGNGKIVWQEQQSNQEPVSNSDAGDEDGQDLPF